MKVDKLTPFKLWTLQNFPFIAEDFDALTNYEIMCKIIEKLNEVIALTNEQTETFKYLSEEFVKLKDYVDKYLVGLDDVKAEIELINNTLDDIANTLEIYRGDINNLTIKIDSEINRVINLINENYNILKSYVDYQDNIINERIDNLQIGLINVYDPTSGTMQTLQTTINNLYQLSNVNGITASEFDNLELTVTAFENYNITAYEFDSQAKNILV